MVQGTSDVLLCCKVQGCTLLFIPKACKTYPQNPEQSRELLEQILALSLLDTWCFAAAVRYLNRPPFYLQPIPLALASTPSTSTYDARVAAGLRVTACPKAFAKHLHAFTSPHYGPSMAKLPLLQSSGKDKPLVLHACLPLLDAMPAIQSLTPCLHSFPHGPTTWCLAQILLTSHTMDSCYQCAERSHLQNFQEM